MLPGLRLPRELAMKRQNRSDARVRRTELRDLFFLTDIR
jgi:hypothetical protein